MPSGFANGINVKVVTACTLTVTQVTFQNTCVTGVRNIIQLYTNYSGSCTASAGAPALNDIVVNGFYSTSPMSGADINLYGYSSADPIVAYFGNLKITGSYSMDTSSPPQYGTYYLDNVNGFTPAGTGITNSTFSINGSVPSCAF